LEESRLKETSSSEIQCMLISLPLFCYILT
jgi:hypothetical protein